MTIVCFDFETWDPLLRKFGSGAIFKYHYGDKIDFELLGVGVKTEQQEEYIDFTKDFFVAKERFNYYMGKATILVAHNAAYDLGCIKYLYKECKDIEKYLPIIHDTMLMGKLDTQQLNSYSLDSLGQHYNCENVKTSDMLHEFAWSTGLYQMVHKEKTGRNCHTRPSDALLEKFCKTNLKLFPSEIVGEYCMVDVRTTWDLYHKLATKLEYYDLEPLSKIIKICLKSKFNGLRIDLQATKKLSKQWKELVGTSKNTLLDMLEPYTPVEEIDAFNINSGAQLGPVLEKMGIIVPKTIKGAYSITKDWLEEHGHPALKQLEIYRKANKAEKDFIQKLIKYQEIIPEEYKEPGIGMLYPTLKPLGATLTGRFTSGGGQGSLELNMLAVSGRDEHFGLPIRELILPAKEGEQLVCADFSNQEPRLQVHYAKILGCKGVDEVVQGWHADPKMKYHKKVAEMTKLAYDIAKMLTLGLSYGMGAAKMSLRLNKTLEEAKAIIAQYHQMLPFMKQLQQATAKALKTNGYIKTIGGRKLYIDEPYEYMGQMKSNEHKAMSKLIQGSALDQLWQSMINIDEAGLNFLLCVHDEIIISTSQAEIDEKKLVDCMEQAYKLVIPVVAESGIGQSWLAAKPK